MESCCPVDDKAGEVAIGAKGTIVSLMEKELQLQESNRTSKMCAPPPLQVRSEAVSVYCGNFASNGTRQSRGKRSSPCHNLATTTVSTVSCKECRSDDICQRSTFSSKEAFERSVSSRSKEAHKFLNFTSPMSGAPRSRKPVSYHDAASSGMHMMSFVSSSGNYDSVVSRTAAVSPATAAVDDHLTPILSPGLPKLSSPAKLSMAASSVQIVDTRCYRGGRELLRPFPRSVSSPRKQLNFWKL